MDSALGTLHKQTQNHEISLKKKKKEKETFHEEMLPSMTVEYGQISENLCQPGFIPGPPLNTEKKRKSPDRT